MTADEGTSRSRVEKLRADFHRYEDAVRRGAAPSRLARLRVRAAAAFDELGGEPEPAPRSLRDYDHLRFGPYLGVSGEPDAAAAIRDAALASPKVVALRLSDPLEVGVAHDAERLGSIGELPPGPEEYRDIRLETVGRILTSTNVSSRLNVRYFGRVRDLWVNSASTRQMQQTAVESLHKRLAPFLDTPDQRPRLTTVYVRFRSEVAAAQRRTVLRTLQEAIEYPEVHTLTLVEEVRAGRPGVDDALEAIDFARRSGLTELALLGRPRRASEELGSLPGLLHYFNANQVGRILEAAGAAGIRIATMNRVDCGSVARLVWTGLAAARRMGLELGKYSLFPLTLNESAEVVESIQRWFDDWTAAPAFYVDVDTISVNEVFPRRRADEALKTWLDMVAAHHVKVALVDTVLKSEGRHLLKSGPRDSTGVFTLEAIERLNAYARERGVRILWAGGITVPQAYELGRLEVFGLYVTSAVASTRTVGPDHEADPGLAAERFPTLEGVARVKLAIEAGFVETQLRKTGRVQAAERIRAVAKEVVTAPVPADKSSLEELVRGAWTTLE